MPQVSQTRIFHKICLTLFTEVSAYTVLFLQLLVSLKLQQNFEIVYKKTGYVIPIFQLWTSSTMGGNGLARVHCPCVAVRISLLKLQKNNPRSQGLFSFFFFLQLYPRHMEVPNPGVELELQLLAYATAMATLDPSHICNPRRSL